MSDSNPFDFVTVQQHIAEEEKLYRPESSGQFSWLMSAVTLSTKVIASAVRRAGLMDVLGEAGGTNVQGETVQKLDLIANDALKKTLGYRDNVAIIASEEDNEPRVLQEATGEGRYIVMFDPLDGSSNIDANVSVGTIFTIFRDLPEESDPAKSVLQRGVEQVAAGYVVYGSSTTLVYTSGHGVHMFTLDPQYGAYLRTRTNIQMPVHAKQYSVNEAYSQSFPPSHQKYLDWAKNQFGGGYSSRYIGSLVADFHRILLKGGVFLYPPTNTPTNTQPDGKLRLMYECNPLAFIAEQAGGMAIDGKNRIMDVMPKSVHCRVPLVIGSKQNVEEVMNFTN